jgi:hypothetical protein
MVANGLQLTVERILCIPGSTVIVNRNNLSAEINRKTKVRAANIITAEE